MFVINIRVVFILIITMVVFGNTAKIKVAKIEPPNWWAGMKNNQIQLMIYGENLDIKKASFNSPFIKVEKIHALQNTGYAFIDIKLDSLITAGNYALSLSNKNAQTKIKYPILAREQSTKRHQGFGPADVIYLITPDRFANGDPANDTVEGMEDKLDRSHDYSRHGGDIQGIIDKLDYLQDLGVTALWINPLTENNMDNAYHGYKTTDFYKIDPRYGTNELYKKLVDEAHKRDMKIILDHVSNHFGKNHPWMKNLPMTDWINGTVDKHKNATHKKAVVLDIYADDNLRSFLTDGWFEDNMPDFNQRNPFVANYIIQNTIWWMEYSGLDGIREDTYPYADARFMAHWANTILYEYPQTNIVGEVWDNNPAVLAWFQKGSYLPRDFDSNLPALTDFAIASAYYNYVTGKSELDLFYTAFYQDHIFPDPANMVTFMDNHDIPRIVMRAGGLSDKLKIAFNLLFTTRRIPQIFYGTEIGIIGGEDHGSLREDFPGGFPGDKQNAFEAEERSTEQNAYFNTLKNLLTLRKKYPALSVGKMIHFEPINNVYVYLKIYQDQKILVVANGNKEEKKIYAVGLDDHLKNMANAENIKNGQVILKDGFKDYKIAPMQVEMFLIK